MLSSSKTQPHAQQARVKIISKTLKKAYPDARTELQFTNPLELMVSTILSAQCTDVRVNLVTPTLFARYRSIQEYAQADLDELNSFIKSINFHRNKAKNIIGACKKIVELHHGQVPKTMETLCALPGIGRKSANVILGNAFGIHEGIVVDTHVIRLSGRLGFSKHVDPVKIERDLMPLVPPKEWTLFSHLLIWHGRRRCKALRPDCWNCEIKNLCPSFPMPTAPKPA